MSGFTSFPLTIFLDKDPSNWIAPYSTPHSHSQSEIHSLLLPDIYPKDGKYYEADMLNSERWSYTLQIKTYLTLKCEVEMEQINTNTVISQLQASNIQCALLCLHFCKVSFHTDIQIIIYLHLQLLSHWSQTFRWHMPELSSRPVVQCKLLPCSGLLLSCFV
jgi:hypothetical protein